MISIDTTKIVLIDMVKALRVFGVSNNLEGDLVIAVCVGVYCNSHLSFVEFYS